MKVVFNEKKRRKRKKGRKKKKERVDPGITLLRFSQTSQIHIQSRNGGPSLLGGGVMGMGKEGIGEGGRN